MAPPHSLSWGCRRRSAAFAPRVPPAAAAMVSAPRCPPGARGLLALLLLLPLPGARGQCGSPPRFNFAEVTGRTWSHYPVGSRLRYSCRPGYTLDPRKLSVVTCDADSTWSLYPEFCIGRPCKPLELENGRVHLTSFRFGATANFSCSEGYKLIGRTSSQCVLVKNGVDWDQEAPFCKVIPCLPPPDITHGSHNALSGEEFFFGLKVTYKCDPGFSLIGEASVFCTTKDNVNGEWSGPAPECKVVKCPEPEVKNGKKHSGFGPDYSYGNIVIFECDSGYTLKGSSSVKCEANNSWVPSLPTCLRIIQTSPSGGIKDTSARSCPHPGKPENGRLVVLTDLMFGATINFICEEGYRLIGHAQRKCVLEGSQVIWDKDIPYCQLIACLPPPEIEHGTHTGTTMEEFNYGTSITYQCDTVERGQVPFSLIGEPSIHCTSTDNVNGDWSGPAPECKVVRCEQPRVDHGKQMTGYSPVYTYGASVLFECDHRYTLKGSNVLHCNENSRWDPQLPVCERSVIW